MNGNVERLENRIKEYAEVLKLSPKIYGKYDKIIETNDAIQLYMSRYFGGVIINMLMYAMIEFDVDKELTVYEKRYNDEYDLRYSDFRDSLLMPAWFFRGLYFANIFGSPILYRKLLELRGKEHMKQLKVLLTTGGSYINNVECRRELIEFINSHTIEEDVVL
jgi:hypothetical protein